MKALDIWAMGVTLYCFLFGVVSLAPVSYIHTIYLVIELCIKTYFHSLIHFINLD